MPAGADGATSPHNTKSLATVLGKLFKAKSMGPQEWPTYRWPRIRRPSLEPRAPSQHC